MKTAEEWLNELYSSRHGQSTIITDDEIKQIQLDAMQPKNLRAEEQLNALTEILNKHLTLERLQRIDKEADEKVGEGILNNEDIYEIALREYRLEAMKEGMRRASTMCQARRGAKMWYELRDAILTAAEQLTEKDLT